MGKFTDILTDELKKTLFDLIGLTIKFMVGAVIIYFLIQYVLPNSFSKFINKQKENISSNTTTPISQPLTP